MKSKYVAAKKLYNGAVVLKIPRKLTCGSSFCNVYATRNVDNIPCFKIRQNFFKNSFFPSTIIEWNNLDPTLRNSKSFVDFKNSILKFIRPSPSNVFNCNNYKSIRLITQLRVGMSHLCEHKFKHNFQDCLNAICSCGLDIESTSYFLL